MTSPKQARETKRDLNARYGRRRRRRNQFWWLATAAAVATCRPALAADSKSNGTPAAAAAAADDPCDGLLATLDRPTVADSPCVVKPWRLITEQGYQTGPVKGSDVGHLSQLPQGELRYGLPQNWELKLFPPNYNVATQRAGDGHTVGFGDTAVGAKHEFGTFGGFVFAADTKLTLPTGRAAFSDGGVEASLQGIVGYNITPKLGVSTLTHRLDSGRVVRFTGVNPDVVVTYLINDSLQLYSELYGNTVTVPHEGPNLFYQGGVQYLLTKSIEVDLSGGALLRGPAGLPSRYIDAGVGLLF